MRVGRGLSAWWLPSCSPRRRLQQRPVQGHPQIWRAVLLNCLACQGLEEQPICRPKDPHVGTLNLNNRAPTPTPPQTCRTNRISPAHNDNPRRIRTPRPQRHAQMPSSRTHGPSVNSMVEELPQFKPRKWGMNIRYPVWMTKRILKQSLQGLAFFHEHGIAQGDFQPGNMLFSLDSAVDLMGEEELWQKTEDEESGQVLLAKVQRLDEKEDKSAPPYLYVGQPLALSTNHGEGFQVKLSDMGGG
ncbi:uncharacterized protein BDV14DRAFT_34059 [Aspergillus stella-maris]|uniref:uncharacterized protein n=1 Tax=Aspergillus stella-maris TaxID=1810926 RepID=UPI003CCD444E